jgi:hypothetical protein
LENVWQSDSLRDGASDSGKDEEEFSHFFVIMCVRVCVVC